MQQKKEYKKRLFAYCIALIQQRIDAARIAMDNAQQAANSEEKSSAGDKYETARAMGHIEKDMHAKQLQANRAELAALMSINAEAVYTGIASGALVECGPNIFFIAAGLGKITFEGASVFVLSPKAPLAQLLTGKKKGDTISFNGKELIIKTVC